MEDTRQQEPDALRSTNPDLYEGGIRVPIALYPRLCALEKR